MRGLLVGRFQPFHAGHLEVVRRIRAGRPDAPLILGIGSAQESYTLENPLTAGERLELIEASLAEAGITGTIAVPLPDIDRHAQWVAYVASMVPAFDRVYTNNPLTELLFERAGYAVERPPLVDRTRFEGTRLRALMAEGGAWQELVAPAAARFLTAHHVPERLKLLAHGSGASERAPP